MHQWSKQGETPMVQKVPLHRLHEAELSGRMRSDGKRGVIRAACIVVTGVIGRSKSDGHRRNSWDERVRVTDDRTTTTTTTTTATTTTTTAAAAAATTRRVVPHSSILSLHSMDHTMFLHYATRVHIHIVYFSPCTRMSDGDPMRWSMSVAAALNATSSPLWSTKTACSFFFSLFFISTSLRLHDKQKPASEHLLRSDHVHSYWLDELEGLNSNPHGGEDHCFPRRLQISKIKCFPCKHHHLLEGDSRNYM